MKGTAKALCLVLLCLALKDADAQQDSSSGQVPAPSASEAAAAIKGCFEDPPSSLLNSASFPSPTEPELFVYFIVQDDLSGKAAIARAFPAHPLCVSDNQLELTRLYIICKAVMIKSASLSGAISCAG